MRCPLKGRRIINEPERLWFHAPDKSPKDHTICYDCIKRVKDPNGYVTITGLNNVNCDHDTMENKLSDNFEISLQQEGMIGTIPCGKVVYFPGYKRFMIQIKSTTNNFLKIEECVVGKNEFPLEKQIMAKGVTIRKPGFVYIPKNRTIVTLKIQKYIPTKEPISMRDPPQSAFFEKFEEPETIQFEILCSDSEEELEEKKEEFRTQKKEKERTLKRLREEIDELNEFI